MKLYIHIPFCHSKCAYCDFYSTPQTEWMETFVNAVINEWNYRSKNLSEGIDTLYLGGGTPSSLPPDLLSCLLKKLPTGDGLREATIEANPEDITTEWVRFLTSETPFHRVSMGIQSFSDKELSIVGRRHDSVTAIEAIHTLRTGGIKNISCDLIYGLPSQDIESWKYSLDTLLSLKPEHISAYLLSYETGTRLNAMLQSGKIEETDEDTVKAMYDYLCLATKKNGYSHYEISNFALPGYQAIHNSSYWDGSPYIGLGPGAHSWDGHSRSFNPPSLKDYIAKNGYSTSVTEHETEDNRFNDLLITRLRTLRGIDPQEIKKRFDPDFYNCFMETAAKLIANGEFDTNPDGTYFIPENRWLTSNSIILNLIRV